MNEAAQQLTRRLNGLVARRPGLAIGLWGEAGIGKTHAALALLHNTPCQSVTVHSTQALEAIIRAIPRPKKPSVWLERSCERLLKGEVLELDALVQTLGGLLSANAPLILHVEDLHEATPDRLEVWQQLAGAVTRTRGVGLITTSRMQPPDGFEVIRLESLNRTASDGLLEAEAGATLPAEACSWIFMHAQGNPLFTLEFFRFLARHGFVWNDGQRWRWRVPERQVMPVTVEAIIERSISEACPDIATRTALEARAYLESLEPNLKLEANIWAHVAGFDMAALERAERNLWARGIMNESGFVHPLFREVPIKGFNARDRQMFATRALEVLPLEVGAVFIADAQLGPERSLELLERAAVDMTVAGHPVKAARFQTQAVEHASGEARAKLALAAAQVLRKVDITQASRLADLAALEPTQAEQAILLGAELLAVQGRLIEAEGRLEALLNPNRPLENTSRRLKLRTMARNFTAALELWRQHPTLHASDDPTVLQAAVLTLYSTDHVEEARSVLRRAQGIVSPQDQVLFAGLEANLVANDGETERAAKLYASRAAKLLASGDLSQAAIALKNHGVMMERLGRFRESSSLYEQAAHHFAELGDLRRVADARAGVAWNLWHLGEYVDAETIFLESIDLQRRFAFTDHLVFCEGCLSLMYLDWSPPLAVDLASKHARVALEVARQLGNASDIVDSLFDNVLVRLRQGRPSAAQVFVDEMTLLCETHGLSGTRITAMYCQALVLEALEDPDGALRLMSQAETEHRGSEMFKTKIGIEIARLSGDLGRARRHLEWFQAHGVVNGVNVLYRYFPELASDVIEANLDTRRETRNGTHLQVLGNVQIRIAGTPEPVRGGKRKALLAVLLEARIMGRSEVSKLDLFDTLYPDMIEAQASAALKNLVYQMRELCGNDVIHSTDGGYTLGAITSDAEAFLETADTRLWHGEYLEGLHLGAEETVRETLHLALRNRAEHLLETDPTEVVRVGRMLCAADPYDLDGLRLTLQALRASDNHKSLKSTYNRAREGLLEIGEVLPERWADFLEDLTGKTA